MAWVTPRDWTNHEFVEAVHMNTLNANFDEVETAKVLAAGWMFYASAANTIVGIAPGDAGDVAVVNAGANGFGWTGRTPLQRPLYGNDSNMLSLYPFFTQAANVTITTTAGGLVLIIGAVMTDMVPDTSTDANMIYRVQRAPAAGGDSVSVYDSPIIYGAATNSNTFTIPWPVFAIDEPDAGDWTYFLSAAYFNNSGTVTATGRLAVVEF